MRYILLICYAAAFMLAFSLSVQLRWENEQRQAQADSAAAAVHEQRAILIEKIQQLDSARARLREVERQPPIHRGVPHKDPSP